VQTVRSSPGVNAPHSNGSGGGPSVPSLLPVSVVAGPVSPLPSLVPAVTVTPVPSVPPVPPVVGASLAEPAPLLVSPPLLPLLAPSPPQAVSRAAPIAIRRIRIGSP
jgi:hypothetical protein